MDAQASKALKNQFEMDKLLQSELNTFILSKKYEQIKRLLGRFRARSKKRSGPSACLVIRFLENVDKIKDNQKMPYLSQAFAITDKTTIDDIYKQSVEFFELKDRAQELE